MLIAYYRVSTARQGRSGLGLEAQRAAVEAYARDRGETLAASLTEIESGRCRDRPELAKAVAMVRALGATLVVAKLDRLARDVRLILGLVDSGIRVLLLDLPELSADPITGRLMLTVLAAIAEWEARRIGQRIREALAARKARGLPPCHSPSPEHCRRYQPLGVAAARIENRRRAGEFRAGLRPVARGLVDGGMSLREAAVEMNRRGYRTRRGLEWTLANLHVLLTPAEWEGCQPGARGLHAPQPPG